MRAVSALLGLGRSYLLLCASEAVTTFGSVLTSFAMGVWIYRHSGLAMDFAVLQIVSTLPALLALPWSGGLTDRLSKPRVVFVSNITAALAIAVIVVFISWHELLVWHLYVLGFINSLALSFRMPAVRSLASILLQPQHLTRGNGLLTLSHGVMALLAPMVAGVLMVIASLPAILMLEAVLLVLSCVPLLGIRVISLPQIGDPATGKDFSAWSFTRSLRDNLHEALAFFSGQPLMRTLLLYTIVQQALIGLVTTLLAPLVLANYSSIELSLVMGFGGLGGALGSIALILVGQQRNLMISLLLADAVISACVLLTGVHVSLKLYIACAFVSFAAGTAAMIYGDALWMSKVPAQRRGRVFALIGIAQLVVAPLTAAVGAYVADHIFGPALATGGAFSQTMSAWFGDGGGRPIRLVFTIAGIVSLLLAAFGMSRVRFRSLDQLVPDCSHAMPEQRVDDGLKLTHVN